MKTQTSDNLEIIGEWETRRIWYNIIMLFVGMGSFFIGYATIPLLYVLFAISLNILFTFSWILEIVLIKSFDSDRLTSNYQKIFLWVFYSYSVFSVLFYVKFPYLLDWSLRIYGF